MRSDLWFICVPSLTLDEECFSPIASLLLFSTFPLLSVILTVSEMQLSANNLSRSVAYPYYRSSLETVFGRAIHLFRGFLIFQNGTAHKA